VWGIVPSNFEPFHNEAIDSIDQKLKDIWHSLSKKGIDVDLMISRSLLSPATCFLVNPDGFKTVEGAFRMTKALSERLRGNSRPFEKKVSRRTKK